MKPSVLVEEITLAWLEKECPAVFKAAVEQGAATAKVEAETASKAAAAAAEQAQASAVAAARAEGATAERDRILGIEAAALPGHGELIAQLKADPKATPESAAMKVLAAEREKRGKTLSDLRTEDASLKDLAPSNDGGDSADRKARLAAAAKRVSA